MTKNIMNDNSGNALSEIYDVPCNPYIHRGDVIVYPGPGKIVNGVEAGKRPCVVVSSDDGNKSSSSVIVVPMTSQQRRNMLIHYKITKEKYPFLKKDSTLLCEQLVTISKQDIQMVLGKINDYDLAIVDSCISCALGLAH